VGKSGWAKERETSSWSDAGVKISVVTVCFNSARTIRSTLESFFEQDHPDKELVIVDGGSTDATLEIIASFPQAGVSLKSEPDGGIFDAMNKGLARFAGDAVGFLNSDDRFHDARVLSDAAAALAEADMAFGHIDFVSNDGRRRLVRRWQATPYPRGGFRSGWMPAHPSFYVRRAVAEAVGAFDPALRISADYDWMLRAFELNGFCSRLVDRTFVDMMVGGNSTGSLRTYLDGNLESLESRRRWLGSGVVDYALFAKPLRKVGQFVGAG
jgi:glycosyltransferase involved in cell wall biosynthesis